MSMHAGRGCGVGPVRLLCAVLLLAAPVSASAERTAVAVRVVAKGAKFIGDAMGGARVAIHDAETGELLADGVTRGGTGDTERLMTQRIERPAPRSTPDAAVFRATLDLKAPRLVRITARGPLGQPQAAVEASSTMWVAPGLPLTGGDAVVLELAGFAVDIVTPLAHSTIAAGQKVDVRANVVMLCGCPIEPKGLWDANAMTFVAHVYRDGKEVARVPARYAGKTNQFVATLNLRGAGAYLVRFIAHDPRNGNTGLDAVGFLVK